MSPPINILRVLPADAHIDAIHPPQLPLSPISASIVKRCINSYTSPASSLPPPAGPGRGALARGMTLTTGRPVPEPVTGTTAAKSTSVTPAAALASSSSPSSSSSSPSSASYACALKNKKKGWRGEAGAEEVEEVVMTGRERLKRHRMEMAGRVWIPEMWGQEGLLKEWVGSSSAVERSLVPKGSVSARAALVEECRRANSRYPQIKNPC